MNDTREFKINLHADEADDAVISPEPGEEKPKSPFKKSLLLVLVFGIAVGLIIGGLYYHLNTKIQTINSRGFAGIASLSEETNVKLLEFSALLSDQKNQLQKQVDELDNRLKKLNTSIAAVQTGKPNKKDMDAAIAQITNDLKPLRQSMTALDDKLTGITKDTRLVAENLEKTRMEMSQIRKEITGLNEIYIDRASFEKETKKEREFNQQNMAHASETLFSEIASLHKQITALEKKLNDLAASSSRKPVPSGNIPEKQTPPSLDNVKPGPGEIIEQEINPPEQPLP
jgi:prefoldin subunit 5